MVALKQINFTGTAEEQVKQMYDLVVSVVNDHNKNESKLKKTQADLKQARIDINKLKGELGV